MFTDEGTEKVSNFCKLIELVVDGRLGTQCDQFQCQAFCLYSTWPP